MRCSITTFLCLILLSSCKSTRVHEHKDWGKFFEGYGIKNGCFIMTDQVHEATHYYNKDRCLKRFSPASTFKIFNSLAALEAPVVANESIVIPWDSVVRRLPEWNRDMDMREAFKVSNVGYYQEIARRLGQERMQKYLDTVKYGNMVIGGSVDSFWLNNSLQISADEQLGFIKKLYFNELPFSERSQRIVRSMMLREEGPAYKLYYKTGWGINGDATEVLWMVGYIEKIMQVKENKDAMNKSNERIYPYFFSMNFDISSSDTTQNWGEVRKEIVKKVLQDFGAMKDHKIVAQ